MSVFNENQLKSLIRKYVQEESKKYKSELDKLWEYLNKLREEIKAVESLIGTIEGRKSLEVKR